MPLSQQDFFDEQFFAQFPELAGQTRSLAGQLFPADALSGADQRELAALQARTARLAPMQAPAMQGSTAIPGNPYSIDTSGVTNAVQQGLVNIINAERQRRLIGDPEEAARLRERAEGAPTAARIHLEGEARKVDSPLTRLAELTQRQQHTAAQQDSQRAFMEKLYPDMVGKLFDAQRDLSTEAGRQRGREQLLDSRHDFLEEQNRLDRENRLAVQRLIQGRSGAGGGPGGTDGLSTQSGVNIANRIGKSGEQYEKRAQAILDFKREWGERANEQWGGNIDEDYAEAVAKAGRFNLLAAKTPASLMTPPDIIKEYMELLGIEEAGDDEILDVSDIWSQE